MMSHFLHMITARYVQWNLFKLVIIQLKFFWPSYAGGCFIVTKYFTKGHRAHDLSDFSDDTPIFIHNSGSSGVIPGRTVTSTGPRLYTIKTSTGLSRCNRSHLNYIQVG